MADKMTLLYIEAVGLVAAALTRTSAPDAQLPAAELAGDRLAVRSAPGDPEFAIPAGQLAAVVVDRADDVLLRPRRYHIVDDVPQPIDDGPLSDVTGSPGAVTLSLPTGEPDPSPHAVTEPLTAWVLIQGGLTAQPVVATASVPAHASSVVVPVPVEHGSYDILAIVTGYEPWTGPVDL